ncbi:hypothetical protein CHS0354_007920 [Potamilus streckersoni]|uniref:Uncharacterized protein n=1 Tax=Potamilus streckersoni TaxID=2493646 RepID=A0AAE0VSE9_9BIVA|nr:hypothetical protein CHS0354_007920 [Potamilus streckersoni]
MENGHGCDDYSILVAIIVTMVIIVAMVITLFMIQIMTTLWMTWVITSILSVVDVSGHQRDDLCRYSDHYLDDLLHGHNNDDHDNYRVTGVFLQTNGYEGWIQ